ncbi:MAG: hypothetical protein WBD47_16880 [Phormidesmis sp.]
MANISRLRADRPGEVELFYIRLKTHSDNRLFELSEKAQTERSAASTASLAQIVADELVIAALKRGIHLDQWAIIPGAVQALIFVQESRPGLEASTDKPRLLTSFVAGFKAATAKRINLIRNQPGSPVWQRSYDAQRVDDEFMLARLRQRIATAEDAVISS